MFIMKVLRSVIYSIKLLLVLKTTLTLGIRTIIYSFSELIEPIEKISFLTVKTF